MANYTNLELAELIEHYPGIAVHVRTQDLNFGYITVDAFGFQYDLKFKQFSYPCIFTVTNDGENLWIEAINSAL